MKLIWQYIIILLWAAPLLASCSDTGFEEKPDGNRREEAIHFSLATPIGATTRTATDDEITSIDVIFFKRSGAPGAYTYTFDGGEYDLEFEKETASGPTRILYKTSFLPPSFDDADAVWNVIIITNATASIQAKESGWTGKTMAEVQESLMVDLTKTPVTNPKTYFTPGELFLTETDATGIPMYAILENRALNNMSEKQLKEISVVRMVAKITINNYFTNAGVTDVAKRKIKITEATLDNDNKTGCMYMNYYTNDVLESYLVPTMPAAPQKEDRTFQKSDFTNITIDGKEVQTITFYAFESRNSDKELGSGEEVIYLDNDFVKNHTAGNPKGYTYIHLKAEYNGDASDIIEYILPIPRVTTVVSKNELGDILRNHHYILNIYGASRTILIDAFVKVTDWKERDFGVDL